MADGFVNHIGIATHSLDKAEELWSKLGFSFGGDHTNEEQGVKIRFMEGRGSTRIEILQPLNDESPVGRFLSSSGPGVQQIAVNVVDIESTIVELKEIGVRMVSDEPTVGSDGHRIAFVHPSSSGGVLIELVESTM